jgi:hypothetical protein
VCVFVCVLSRPVAATVTPLARVPVPQPKDGVFEVFAIVAAAARDKVRWHVNIRLTVLFPLWQRLRVGAATGTVPGHTRPLTSLSPLRLVFTTRERTHTTVAAACRGSGDRPW